MNKYSNFENNIGKTRNEEVLDDSLKKLTNYKDASQNFTNLDGRYFDDKNFYGLDNPEKYDNDAPTTFFNDPRYNQNNTRNESRKQINNKTNIKIQKNLPGLNDDNNKYQEFNETNYEDPKFAESFRDFGLNSNSRSVGITESNTKKVNLETDLQKIIKKVKNNSILNDDIKPVLRMPNKKITADTIKGKILQFKNISEDIQDMISHALINIWKEDFAIKKISSHLGVKNFILSNFKDKLNCFFVLFDDDGDFVATFAIDTENFAPYISHLFVNPNLRNKGFGKKALKYAEKYIQKIGFNSSGLWCEESLIPYYKKFGYTIESPMEISEDKVIWKMGKNL